MRQISRGWKLYWRKVEHQELFFVFANMVTNVHHLWRRIELHLCDNTINSYQCKLKTTYEAFVLLLSSEQSCTHPCFLFCPLLLHSSSVNINPFSLVLITSYNAFLLGTHLFFAICVMMWSRSVEFFLYNMAMLDKRVLL